MYYVYILKNPITALPFYVGVAKVNRCSNRPREQDHIHEAIKYAKGLKITSPNRHKLNTILQILDQGLDVVIEIYKHYNIESLAFTDEIELIKHFGRKDIGTGILTNMTDGGEGRVNPSLESRRKQSLATKGKQSHAKGKKLGRYSEERKQIVKQKIAYKKQSKTAAERKVEYENRRNGQLGKIPWNKGKTKETDTIIAECARNKLGVARIDMIGNVPWNKGKTKETDEKIAMLSAQWKGRSAPNKGVPSKQKGRTYEEIYGKEKAEELKELRRLKKIEYWQNKQDLAK